MSCSRVGSYLIAFVLIVIACALGRWQLQRAQAKEEQVVLISALADQIITTRDALKNRERVLFHRLYVCGRWLSAATVYLDNRPNQMGEAGIEVITPLQIEAVKNRHERCEIEHNNSTTTTLKKQPVILVKRGWLPRHLLDRNQIRPFQTATGLVEVEGLILPDVSRVYHLGKEAGPKELRLRQNLDLTEFAHAFSLTLYPFILQQEEWTQDPVVLNDGLQRNWSKIDHRIERHYGYAFQWFSLAALIGGLCLYFSYPSLRKIIFKKRSS